MSMDLTKLGRAGDCARKRTTPTSTGSLPANARTHVKSYKVEKSQTPNSKDLPAVKDLDKFRPKRGPAVKESPKLRSQPLGSSKAKLNSTARVIKSGCTNSVKKPNPGQVGSVLGVSKIPSGETKAKYVTAMSDSHRKVTSSGRQDPYDIPSGSEVDDASGGKRVSITTSQRIHSSPSKARANTISLRNPIYTLPLTPTPTSRTRPATSNSLGSSRNTPIEIPADNAIIPSSPPSHDVGSSQISTSVRPPVKSFGKRFSRATNDHLNTTDGLQNTAPVLMSNNPKSKSTLGQHRSSPISLDSDITSSKKKHEDRKKPVEYGQPRKNGQAGSSPNQPHISDAPNGPKQQRCQGNEDKVRKAKKTIALPKIIKSSPETTIRSERKAAKVHFDHEDDEPAPKVSVEEPDHSDDEYLPPSNDEQQSIASSDNGAISSRTPKPGTPTCAVENTQPSESSPTRCLRSDSYPEPTTSFTPINKPPSKPAKRESTTRSPTSRSSHDHPASACNAVLSKSSSRKREVKTNRKDTRKDRQIDSENINGNGPKNRAKAQWTPYTWMEKYEVMFQVKKGKSIIFNGPFCGWILEGPGEGSYMPGYHAPSESTLAIAEEDATLRAKSMLADSPIDLTSEGENPDDEVRESNIQQNARQDTIVSNNVEYSAPISKEESRHAADPPCTPEVSRASGPEHEDKTTGRAERMKRTRHYILASSSSDTTDSQPVINTPDPTLSKLQLGLTLKPALTTVSNDNPSISSAASEAAPALIEQQLLNDCAPPSNQELGELMSSSPAKQYARASSPSVLNANEQADSGGNGSINSSSESSSGIPARMETPPQLVAARRKQDESLSLDHPSAAHVTNGIAERRTTRFLAERPPSATKSGPLLSRASSSHIGVNATPGPPCSKTNIMIELPVLTGEEQAEYEVLSPSREANGFSTPPPKSLKEINEATSTINTESNNSDVEEALNYVLRESPNWLGGITELEETEAGDAGINMPKPSLKRSGKDVPKKLSADTSKLITLDSNNQVPNVPLPTCTQELTNKDKKQLKQPPRTPRRAPEPRTRARSGDKTNDPLSSDTRGEKRNIPPSNILIDESPIAKKQKTDDNRSYETEGKVKKAKKKNHSKRERERTRIRREQQQQQQQ
ncbi:uncharacterized protein F4822DRAFT_443275 [Hypoxylon trugodes]|uniref:uncharacterized protein n=1 Tax=Hypoxylon trugodes TaxID=326681 RepID=UPI00219526D1|nr:uncharacterized protein F4822DRAFT_443275 [Hypoxylon trugodes]KAI1390422.1 hypothetical protein F4822DRAFT_443275 [Hypoxylon trugodes]